MSSRTCSLKEKTYPQISLRAGKRRSDGLIRTDRRCSPFSSASLPAYPLTSNSSIANSTAANSAMAVAHASENVCAIFLYFLDESLIPAFHPGEVSESGEVASILSDT